MDTTADLDNLPAFTLDQFKAFVEQSGHSDSGGRPMRAGVMVIPLIGEGAGKPFRAIATRVNQNYIRLEAPQRLDIGQRICIRLTTSTGVAAWVECAARSWDLDGTICKIEAEFVKKACPHACKCPAFVFVQYGQRVQCPHAGHSGCLQASAVGPQIKAMLNPSSH